MQISEQGIALIKRFEGLVLETYDDGVGIQTVGYGHTGAFRGYPSVAAAVEANGGQPIQITEQEADELLRDDLDAFVAGVNRYIKVPTAQSMFDAFVSLAFNIGIEAFRKSTTLKEHNKKNYTLAAEAITWWNKAGGQVLTGLVRRRSAEEALYLDGLDEVVEDEPAVSNDIEENSPRRNNPVTTRTTAGATAAGAAGATGAGTVLMGDEDEETGTTETGTATETGTDTQTGTDTGEETETGDTGTETESTDQDTTGEEAGEETETGTTEDTAADETTTGTEVPADEPQNGFTQDETTDAIIVIAGAIAVLAALWVIFARIDDWRNYRR